MESKDECERVADLVMAADTLDECFQAEEALRDYLKHHPDDFAMRDIGEQLTLIKEARQEAASADLVPVVR